MPRYVWLLLPLLAACDGSGDAPDAAVEDAGLSDAGGDAGRDAGVDAGPPVTGCDLARDGGLVGDAGPMPAPGAFDPPRGPGGPATVFSADQLGEPCAYLPMGETDEDHHNTGFFLDGYLVRPWAHERGRGGVAVWDISTPCAPVLVANVLDAQIRETHSTGLSRIGGRWIAVASLQGIQIWDASDVTAPALVTDLALPGVRYPDSYMRVVMSVFWQAPYLFVGASDNGIYVIDAGDPTSPEIVAQWLPEPLFRVGQVIVIGNWLYAFSSEGSVAAVVDVRDPRSPRPVPGGRWTITNGDEDRLERPVPLPAYFGHVSGGYAYHPRIGIGGGLAIFDVRDPFAPAFVGDFDAPDGDGGYVYLKEGVAYVGLSDYGAAIDVRDPSAPVLLRRFELTGDLDTVTPFGNVALVSVDDDAVAGQASAIMPMFEAVDARGPAVNMVVPTDGATDQPLSTRIGLTFDEFVEMNSVWAGSVLLRETESGRVVQAHLSGQEGVVNLWPVHPLSPATEYTLTVPAGGVTDLNGNATASTFGATFTTVACEE